MKNNHAKWSWACLGLSIAKDLCNLQNGELKINIDGDLFKAIVKLPKA